MAIRNDFGVDGQGPMAVEAAYEGILPPAPPANPNDPAAPRQVAQNTASTPPVVTTIELEDGNVARLPADTDITNVRANGADLEFVQPDGTVIVIPSGSIANLVLFVGDIQIPAEAVELMFTTAGIEPAAGPETGPDGGSGSFVDLGEQNVGEGFQRNSLLADSDFGAVTVNDDDQLTDGQRPNITILTGTYTIADDGLSDGNREDGLSDSSVATGTFTARDAQPMTLVVNPPAGTFQSSGHEILWDQADPLHLVGYYEIPNGDEGTTRVTVVTFDLDVTETLDGGVYTAAVTWTMTLEQPLDHPLASADDLLFMPFTVSVSDGINPPSVATFNMAVEDDEPWLAHEKPGENESEAAPLPGHIDEDDLSGGQSGGPGDNDGSKSVTGVLNILWGADRADFDDSDDGTQDGAVGGSVNNAQLTGRAVYFSTGLVTVGYDVEPGENGPAPLKSRGETVEYRLDESGTKLIGYVGEGDDERPVFEVLLGDDADRGSYTFVLKDVLDHPVAGTEDDISLTFQFTARDFDGDTVSGSFTVLVDDDMPKLVTGQTETGTADEDDLASLNPLYPYVLDFWQGSLGTSPYDGWQPDHSITGLLGTVPVWGDLSHLVNPGADGDGGFSLVTQGAATAWLATAGGSGFLTSKNSTINNAQHIDLPIIGEAIGFFAADGRLIFGLYLDESGTYNFRLFDQIDHLQGNGTTAADAVENVLPLDLSKLISYSDGDGDSILLGAGQFVINVVDDIPLAQGSEKHSLNEDDLANYNPLHDFLGPDFWQGSMGTSPFDGFTDDSITGLLGTVPVWGTLIDNVRGGADGLGAFSLVSESDAETLLATLDGGVPFESRGSAITGAESINILGFGEAMGFFAADGRLVFGLYVDELGTYNFRLFDQLDHEPGAGKNSLGIDLGKFVTYTDTDGDVIDLGVDRFVMTVVDDVPEVRATLVVTLNEADLHNFLPGYDLLKLAGAFIEGSNGTNPANGAPLGDILNALGTGQTGLLNTVIPNILLPGQGSNVVAGGADEGGVGFQLVTASAAAALLATNAHAWYSNGDRIDRVETLDLDLLGLADATVMAFYSADDRLIFTLSITDFGGYDIRLFDQIDHTGTGNGHSFTLNLGDFVTYTDFDGDTIDLGPTDTSGDHLVLIVNDDKPETVAGAKVVGTVEEEHKPTGLELLDGGDMQHGNEDGDDDAGGLDGDTSGSLTAITHITTGSLASLVKGGADEDGIFSLNSGIIGQPVTIVGTGSERIPVKSRGEDVLFAIHDNKLIGYVDRGDAGFQTTDRWVFTLTLSEPVLDTATLSQYLPPEIMASLGSLLPQELLAVFGQFLPPGLLDGIVNEQFKFTLLDQLDHPTPEGGASENLLTLDLSGAIQFTDFDGDTIPLDLNSVQIEVVDDIPRQIKAALTLQAVEEEHLAGGNDDKNDPTANPEPDSDFNLNRVTNTVEGDMRTLVSVGADESSQQPGYTIPGTPEFKIGPIVIWPGTPPINIPGGSGGTFFIGGPEGLPTDLTSQGGPVRYHYSDSNDDGSLFDKITGYVDGDGVEGYQANGLDRPVFEFSLTNSGEDAGKFRFSLLDQIDQPGVGENVTTIDFSGTIRFADYDGDVITLAPNSVAIRVIDDIPVAKDHTVTNANILDDDIQTVVAAGNATPNDNVADKGATTGVAAGTLFAMGADEIGSVVVTGFPTMSFIAKNAAGFAVSEPVTEWVLTTDGANGASVTYTAVTSSYTEANGGAAVLTINIDGSYTFTVKAPVTNHLVQANEETTSFKFDFKVTDHDDDEDTGSLTVKINDDRPTPTSGAEVTASPTLDDEGQTSVAVGVPSGTGDITGEAVYTTGSGFFSSGADGVKSIDLNTPPGFTAIYKDASGFAVTQAVTWTKLAESGEVGAVKWVATGGTFTATSPAATLVIETDGDYRFNAYAPIVHSGANEQSTTLAFSVTVTDGDNDTITRTLNIVINDDAPTGGGSVGSPALDDEGQTAFLPGNTDAVDGDIPGAAKSTGGLPGSLFNIGADGLQKVQLTSLPADFKVIYNDAGTAKQEDATWSPTGVPGANGSTTFTASSSHYSGSTPAAQLTIFADGSYTITFNAPVVHPNNSLTEESKSFEFNYKAFDGDGDFVTGTLTVLVNDDRPIIGTVITNTVDEELIGGNIDAAITGNGDYSPDSVSASGTLNISFGSDGPAPVVSSAAGATVNFNQFANGTPGPLQVGAYIFTTNEGIAAHPANDGMLIGKVLGITSSGGPFTVSTFNIGLNGSMGQPSALVYITGVDADGNTIVVQKTVFGMVHPVGTALTTLIDLAGTDLAGKLLTSLSITAEQSHLVNVRVMIDNIALGSAPQVTDAPITFEDTASAVANITLRDTDGTLLDITQLEADGQLVKYHLIDAVTLVGYTGTAVPTAIDGSNVVFSVELGSPETGGSYDFVLRGNLDHPEAGTEDDLAFTFDFKAKDGDGDTTPGSFDVRVDDDTPIIKPASTTNLVQNADFQDGEWTLHGWGHDATNVTNWVLEAAPTGAANVVLDRIKSPYAGVSSSDGSDMIDLAATPGNIAISQVIAGTEAGKSYALNFEYGASEPSSAGLAVYWNGVLIGTYSPSSGIMSKITVLVVGTGTNDTIKFVETGSGPDVTGTYLSNIRMYAATAGVVDEDALASNPLNIGGLGDVAAGLTTDGELGILWGADNGSARDVTFPGSLETGPTGLFSDGQPVTFDVTNSGHTLIATANGLPVFTVTIDPSSIHGTYQFTLQGRLDHPLHDVEDNLPITLGFIAKDADGDTVNGSFTVIVNDDTPVAVHNDSVTFNEDELAHGNVMSNDGPGADGATLTKVTFNPSDPLPTWENIDQAIGSSFTRPEGVYTFKPNGEWTFDPIPNYNGPAGFAYIIADGDGDESDPEVALGNPVVITTTPVPDAPVLTVAVNSVSYIEPANANMSNLTDGYRVFAGSTFALTDGDGTAGYQSVTVTAATAGDKLFIRMSDQGGLALHNGTVVITQSEFATGTLTISKAGGGNLTESEVIAALQDIIFHTDEQTATPESHSLSIIVKDQTGLAGTPVVMTVAVTGTNDAPSWKNAALATTTAEDVPFALHQKFIDTQITPNDRDAEGPMSLTLTATSGTILIDPSVAALHGISYIVSESGTATVTLTGSLAAIEDFLVNSTNTASGVTFVPMPDFHGAASIQMTISDQGDQGHGAALGTSVINITVSPVNDAPVIAPAAAVVVFNGNFEADIDDSDYTQSGPEGRWSNGAPTGWVLTGGTHGGFFDPTPNGAPGTDGVLPMDEDNGINVLWLNDGRSASNTLATSADVGTYVFDFDVGDRRDANLTGQPAYRAALYAGNDLLGEIIVDGVTSGNGAAWTNQSLTVHVAPGTPGIGQALKIVFTNLEGTPGYDQFGGTTQVNFDNVKLSHVAGNVLPTINEDVTDPAGVLVSTILANTVSDVDDGAVEGIAVFGQNDGNGTWQFYKATTSQWVDFGDVTEAGALLLKASDLIRFVPDGANGTHATFQYYAWDQSDIASHPAYSTANVTDGNRGGTSAYSLLDGEASITVSPVNDAPNAPETVSRSISEVGDISGVDEAGRTIRFEPHDFNRETAVDDLFTDGKTVAEVLGALQTTFAHTQQQAFAILWDYLDDRYVDDGHSQPDVNEAFVRLGIEYGYYLKGGGAPFTEVIAKYDAGRNQSLHDNLLGNLTDSPLTSRFNSTLSAQLKAAVDEIGFATSLRFRDYYEGNTGESYADELAYDQANLLTAHVEGTFTATDIDLPTDTLTWSGSTSSALGILTVNANGTWVYQLKPGAADHLSSTQSTTDSFTVTVSDNKGGFDTSTLTITIQGTNDAPVITGSTAVSYVAPELAGFTEAPETIVPSTGLGNFEPITPRDADIITALTNNGANMDGALSALSANRAQAIGLMWDYLDDGYVMGPTNPGINEAFIRLGIEYAKYLLAGNPPLTSTIGKYTPDNDSNGSPDRLQNLHDNLLGNLRYASMSQLGRFNGDFVKLAEFAAAMKAAHVDDLLVRPYFEGNQTSTNNSLLWDQQHGYLPLQSGQLNATDVDGDSVSFSIAAGSAPTYGTFVVNADGMWTYTLNHSLVTRNLPAGQPATDSIVVLASDGKGGFDTHTLTVNFTGQNDLPVSVDASDTILEDGSKTFSPADFAFSDPDTGDGLKAVRIDTLPTEGTLKLNGTDVVAGQVIAAVLIGQLVYTPPANANGAAYATFAFSVQDNSDAFDAVRNTYTINVTAVNDAPVAVDDTYTTAEDTPLQVTVLNGLLVNDTDVDDATINAMFETLPAHGTLSSQSGAGTFIYTPHADYSGTDSFTYKVYDGNGTFSNLATVTINVTAVNDAPVLDDLNASVNWTENQFNDGNFFRLIEQDAAGLTLTDPDSTDFGGGKVIVAYSAGGSAEDHLTVRDNGPGLITVIGQDIFYNNVLIGTMAGGNAGNSLDISLNTAATVAAVENLIEHLAYSNSSQAPTGSRTISITISDGDGGTSVARTTVINVSGVNDAPVIDSNGGGATAAVNVSENTTAVTTVTSHDIDGSGTIYSIIGGADESFFDIDEATGQLVFVDAPDFESKLDGGADNVYDVIVRATDTQGAYDEQAIAVTVTDDASETPVLPVPLSENFKTNIDMSHFGGNGRVRIPIAALLANDGVVEGSGITAVPVQGALKVDDYYFEVQVPQNGTTTFSYALTDGFTTSASASVTITRHPVGTDLNGTSVSDYLITRGWSETISGGDSGDFLAKVSGGTLNGGKGNDTLYPLGGNGTYILNGDEGSDILYGSRESGAGTTLNGGTGNDTLFGGTGASGHTHMSGGLDADTFVFLPYSVTSGSAGSANTIQDYVLGQGDVVDLSELFTDLAPDAVTGNYVKNVGGVLQVDRDGTGGSHSFQNLVQVNFGTADHSVKIVLDDDVTVILTLP